MGKLEDGMMEELKGLLPKAPPAYSKTAKQIVEELHSEGSVHITQTMVQKRLSRLINDGKWETTRVGYVSYYWPKRK